jgi:hypothetical protein
MLNKHDNAPFPRQIFTYTRPIDDHEFHLYGCAKRGCDRVNIDYEAFGTRDGKTYCLHHIPLRSKFRLWRQERRNV